MAEAQTQQQAGQHRLQIEDLLKAGTHFGHLTSRWHPKMKPYIFMERNGIHIIDLMQTQAMLDKAAGAAARFGKMGKSVLFVGTKKQAQESVRRHAEACEMPYVVERWLGGMLTNFQTMRRSIRRMEDLFRMEVLPDLAQVRIYTRAYALRLQRTGRMPPIWPRWLGGASDLRRARA